MKAKLILVFISLVVSLNLFSQLGIKGGILYGGTGIDDSGFSNYSNWEPGFFVGTSYSCRLSGKFYIKPGVYLSLLRTSSRYYTPKVNTNIFASELPVLFSFRPDINNNVKLHFDLGVSGRLGLVYSGNDERIKQEEGAEQLRNFDKYNRFAVALNIGVGIEIHNKYTIGVSYVPELTKYNKTREDGYSNLYRSFRLSVGYNFKL
ncbi:MAG: PorT family protein [Prevotella sp.]|nr:PorT family protein [Prevotella sp.]